MYLSKSASSAKAAMSQKKPSRFFRRTSTFLGVSIFLSAMSVTASASCQYVVTNQWSTGFTGAIRITNSTTSAINGWNVSWKYSSDTLTSSWNATVTGTNPFSATNLNWNGAIQPGQSVEFGVQGNKGAASAEIPVISGAVCDGAVASSSVASSVASTSSSKMSSSVASSKASSSSLTSKASSSSVSSAAASSVKSSNSSSIASSSIPSVIAQCNWYGTVYPLCQTTSSGWGYENNKSCIARVTCAAQPAPYGVVGDSTSSVASSSSSSLKSSSSVAVSSSSVKSSIASSSSIKSSVASSSIVSSVATSVKSSSSVSSTSSSAGAEFTGMSTHFDGLGVPYGGCGIPQDKLETQSFVALNVFNTPGVYSFWPRPLAGSDLQYIGEFNNGKNCGRWVRVSIQEYCKGTNDGAQNQPFCRNGTGWIKDGLEGATQDMIVADSCGDDNAWCRDSRYHLDFSLASMNLFALNGSTVNLLPDHDNNRKISWHYIDAPNYTGDINIYFMAGAELWWPAISINHLKNGIHSVEQLINGVWTPAQMNKDMGQAYILQGGTTHFQIRVRDVNDELINGGRVYNFDLPAACNGKCSAAATLATYTIQ